MMNKRFVINMVSSLLLGAALISAPLQAAEKVVVNISKVDGMPWFNRMGEGVVEAGKAFGVNASQVGPSSTDAPQQVKIMWGSDQFWAELVQPGRTSKPCVARGVVI